MQLVLEDIRFNRHITSKQEAITCVAAELVDVGCVLPGYLQGMLDREQQVSTYLGNDIAIPHGTTAVRETVIKTGVKILVCPQGINWGENNTARLIIGIAARDNEHLDILRQLSHRVSDDDFPAAIQNAETPDEVLSVLAGRRSTTDRQETIDVVPSAKQQTFVLKNPHGLHARPAAALVKIVKSLDAEITLENLDRRSVRVDAGNLMRVIALGARQGHHLRFTANGPDAEHALHLLGEALHQRLGETETAEDAKHNVKFHWLRKWFR